MNILSIDPGMKGGIAILNTETNQMKAVPTPLIGKEIDYRRVHEALTFYEPSIVVVEKVHAMPGQGVTSMFNFGLGYGALVALATVSTARLVLVTPQMWKKHVLAGTSKDKDAAIQFCNHTYPNVNLILPRCRNAHDGMADAICLAHYGAHYVK